MHGTTLIFLSGQIFDCQFFPNFTNKSDEKTTFKYKEVGAYFNKYFINIAIDGETEEGDEILSRYTIRSYPTLLILDAKGRVQTRHSGFMKPFILINFGRRIVP